mmetsp:Transcript_45504/g.105116  ORF Transcript_45504/g.105116 Transcript_45504/m.105116 type:complete len:592 (-) Transcript_45504:92-1867(-)
MCSTVVLLLSTVALAACCGFAADQQQEPAGCEGRCGHSATTGTSSTATCKGATPWGCLSSSVGRVHLLGPSFLQVQHRRSSVSGGLSYDGFKLVDGGVDRACRGADPYDNSNDYYELHHSVASLDLCKAKCRDTQLCQGIEYHGNGRCEVWTRSQGIGATFAFDGAMCLRGPIPQFESTAVGKNKVCRGGDENDNEPEYFEMEKGMASIEACKEKCITTPGCQGVEFGDYEGRCEVWTRPEGIGATKPYNGFTCIRYGTALPTTSTTATTTTTSITTTTTTTTTTFPTTSTTTAQPPTTTFLEPTTARGCQCRQSWILTGFSEDPCENWCCNPDGDPGGFWCFVWDSDCQGQNWGYCAGPPPPTTTPPPTLPPPSFGDTQVLQMEWEHFQLVNRLRRKGYVCPEGKEYFPNYDALKFECRLWRAAKGHSQDMADQNYFSHTTQSDGKSPWDRARAQGISANGENIAASCTTAECALEQWKLSDAHCHNLMDPSFNMFSVAVGYNANSDWKFYWTQMFTAGEVVADTSCFSELIEASLVEREPANKRLHEPALPVPWIINNTIDKREAQEHWRSSKSRTETPLLRSSVSTPA